MASRLFSSNGRASSSAGLRSMLSCVFQGSEASRCRSVEERSVQIRWEIREETGVGSERRGLTRERAMWQAPAPRSRTRGRGRLMYSGGVSSV